MTPHCLYFVEYRAYKTPIHVAQGTIFTSEGLSKVEFTNTEGHHCAISDVLLVPALTCNLFSAFAFKKGGVMP